MRLMVTESARAEKSYGADYTSVKYPFSVRKAESNKALAKADVISGKQPFPSSDYDLYVKRDETLARVIMQAQDKLKLWRKGKIYKAMVANRWYYEIAYLDAQVKLWQAELSYNKAMEKIFKEWQSSRPASSSRPGSRFIASLLPSSAGGRGSSIPGTPSSGGSSSGGSTSPDAPISEAPPSTDGYQVPGSEAPASDAPQYMVPGGGEVPAMDQVKAPASGEFDSQTPGQKLKAFLSEPKNLLISAAVLGGALWFFRKGKKAGRKAAERQ